MRIFHQYFLGHLRSTIKKLSLGIIGSLAVWVCTTSNVQAQTRSEDFILKPTIYVNIDATTWKTRGRLLYDVEGTILKKVGLAGFQVVREVIYPHEYELVVIYREEQGAQYAIDAWGTTIRVNFRFSGLGLPQSKTWNIVEFSEDVQFASPPYLDALVKLETHPYYFFLGELLESLMHGQDSSLSEGLKTAVEQRLTVAYPPPSVLAGRATAQDHFMDSSTVVYQDLAFHRALKALQQEGRFSDQELVFIARKVLVSPLRSLRLQAVQVLMQGQDLESCGRFRDLAEHDPDSVIRTQAKQFMHQCPSS